MTGTPADAMAPIEPGPEPIFASDDAVDTLWVKAYDGEVLGEVLFARMAEQVTDPDQARKMRVLSTLERRTREMLVEPLQRAGLSTESSAEAIAEGEALAAALADVSWADFVGSFEAITTQYTALYARIGELDPAEQATSDLLVAHELALRDFGRLEVDGRGDDSLSAVSALPHMREAFPDGLAAAG